MRLNERRLVLTLVVTALTAGATVAHGQQRDLVLFLSPTVQAQSNAAFSNEYAREVRTRLENRLRHRLNFVSSADICKLLQDSGFTCEHIVGRIDAARMAQAMGVDAYMVGELKFNGPAPEVRYQMVDLKRSGLSGWMTVRGGAGDPPRAFAATTVDSMLGQVRAAEAARACSDRRDNGDYRRAIDEARKAFEMYPNHPSAANCAAVAFEAMGAPPDSQIRYYRRAVQGDSLNERAWQRLGALYQSKGDSLAALEAFRSRMYLSPDDRQQWRGVIAGYMTIKRFEEASAIVDEWLERNPADLEFVQLKTRACFEGQMWACAIEALTMQYQVRPELRTDSMFYRDMIAAGAQAGLDSVVLDWSRQGVENLPNDVFLWRARAAALMQAGRRDSAMVAFERVLILDPNDAASALTLAQSVLNGLVIDTLTPVDTNRLYRGAEYLVLAAAAARTRGDTAALMNTAVIYYEHGQKLVQARRQIPLANEWLQRALDNDVQRRLTQPASFFLGLGLMFQIFEFDQQIVRFATPERLQNLSAADRARACGLVAEEADMVRRGRQAMTVGASVAQATAQQFLQQYAGFEQRLPQLREAFKCA